MKKRIQTTSRFSFVHRIFIVLFVFSIVVSLISTFTYLISKYTPKINYTATTFECEWSQPFTIDPLAAFVSTNKNSDLSNIKTEILVSSRFIEDSHPSIDANYLKYVGDICGGKFNANVIYYPFKIFWFLLELGGYLTLIAATSVLVAVVYEFVRSGKFLFSRRKI